MIARLLLLAALAIGGVLIWAFARELPWLAALHDAVADSSPRDEYVQLLERTGVAQLPIGRAWITAADAALSDVQSVSGGFRRSRTIAPEQPVALAYDIPLRRGQRLDVVVHLDGDAPGQAFVEVFDATGAARRAAGVLATDVEAAEDERLIVRVQPELLRAGTLEVTARIGPALRFPVEGAGTANLHSIFGDPRDAGRRSHEGVDIFSPRGTPVLSATSGIVTRVREAGIGGRVVWVWDLERSLHIYYAHLDEQLVTPGTRVEPGDVIGTVGNTGNARTTPPHLHFGIYAPGEGAIDPDAFIRPAPSSHTRRAKR